MMLHMNILIQHDEETQVVEYLYLDPNPPDWFDDQFREMCVKTEFTVSLTDVTLYWRDAPMPEALPEEDELSIIHDSVATFAMKVQRSISVQN